MGRLRRTNLIGLAVLMLGAGCQSSGTQVPSDLGGRPERFSGGAHRRFDRFLGDWGPGSDYTANDWQVSFAEDGRMSVRGPGLTAEGRYSSEGNRASVVYFVRNNRTTQGGRLSQAEYRLSPDGRELVFDTGLPKDPPVRLIRIRAKVSAPWSARVRTPR